MQVKMSLPMGHQDMEDDHDSEAVNSGADRCWHLFGARHVLSMQCEQGRECFCMCAWQYQKLHICGVAQSDVQWQRTAIPPGGLVAVARHWRAAGQGQARRHRENALSIWITANVQIDGCDTGILGYRPLSWAAQKCISSSRAAGCVESYSCR